MLAGSFTLLLSVFDYDAAWVRALSRFCRELVHDPRDFSAGRIVLRQRESDELVAQLAVYDGRDLTIEERKTRLALRDKLALKEQREMRISRGLKLLLGDPTLSPWDPGDAARAVTGFVNHELKDSPFIDPETIKTRVTCPRNREIYRNRYLTRADVASITALRQQRDKKLGHGRHTNTVMELPDEVRGGEAIPAAIPLPKPKPRTMRERIVVPSIRSREAART